MKQIIVTIAIAVLLFTSAPQASACSGRNCYTAARRSDGCVTVWRNKSGVTSQFMWKQCGFRVYRYPPQ